MTSSNDGVHITDNSTDCGEQALPPIPSTAFKSKPLRRKSMNLSYFGNYHDRNSNIPKEMHQVLDTIENDLQSIFRADILKRTNRVKHLYSLSLELHQEIIKYRSKFIVPFVYHALSALNDTFGSIKRLFVKFRRAKQTVSTPKKQISTWKYGIDSYLTQIEEYKCVIQNGLIQSKQLIKTFNRNPKLLSFWIGLFRVNDNQHTSVHIINKTTYKSMKWSNFVIKIRNNKSCRKFKKFPLREMTKILKKKYNVPSMKNTITAHDFMQYLGTLCIPKWAKNIYKYIDEEIRLQCKQSTPSLLSPSTHSTATTDIPPFLLTSQSSLAGISQDDEVDEDEVDHILDIPDPIWDRTASVSSPRAIARTKQHPKYKSTEALQKSFLFPRVDETKAHRSDPTLHHPQMQLLNTSCSHSHISKTPSNHNMSKRSASFRYGKPKPLAHDNRILRSMSLCEEYESGSADNEFPIDDLSYAGHSVSNTPHSPSFSVQDPFNIIALDDAVHDLQKKLILYHGLFKIYSPVLDSYIDVTGILTMDRLYLVSAIKYQLWEELKERTQIDKSINGKLGNEDKPISIEMAHKLISNLHIVEAQHAFHLLPHFVGNTKKTVMLNMLLNHLERDKMRKLSSYFNINESEARKDTAYIQICGVNNVDIVPEKLRSGLLEYVMGDLEWIKEEIRNDVIVITLCRCNYIGCQILQQLNDRKSAYFAKNGLIHEDKVCISEYIGNKIKYTFTDIQMINLQQYHHIVPVTKYNCSDSFGFVLQNDIGSNEDDTICAVRMDANNTRHAWIAHIDFALHGLHEMKDHNSSFIDLEDGNYQDIKEEHKIFHKEDIISEYNPTKQTLINDFSESKSNDEDEYSTHFNFGLYLNYWQLGFENSVKPRYDTLKDELLNNKISPISEADYYELYDQCTKAYKTHVQIKAQCIGPNNAKFNVARGSEITVNHLIAIKLYTDYTKTQQLFKEHCRRYNDDESMLQFIRRNSEIAHWCRYLRETTTFFGTKMRFQGVYTGLKDKLIFPSLTQNFYCPLSTTLCVSVAENYCADYGVIIKLKAAHGGSKYFDVSWLSRYHHEKERLIMGARMKICDVFINGKSTKEYISALHLFEQILNGYEIATEPKIEEKLYQMLAQLLQLDDKYEMPQYIELLLNKRIEKLRQKMRCREPLKRLWLNETAIIRLRHDKLKCLFGGCLFEKTYSVPHACGLFFRRFKINLNDINRVARFSWTIDAEYDDFKHMKARKYIQSPDIVYRINDKETIVFYLTCYPRYTHEKQKCALFLHVRKSPKYVESIKVEYDLLCDWGGNIKYQHVMIPQVLNKYKEYCGCQTFSSNKIKYQYMIWNIGIKIIEVKYSHAMHKNAYEDDLDMKYKEQYCIHSQSEKGNQFMHENQVLNDENQALRLKIERLQQLLHENKIKVN